MRRDITPQISVVIPVYNRSEKIVKTIESVTSQSIPELEILIVDDGSIDDTAEYVMSIDDPRVRFLELYQNSGGPARPMSIGVKHSRAPMIAFLDHDDVAWPNWLESLHDLIVSGDNIGMVWGMMRLVDENGKVLSVAYRDPFGKENSKRILPTMLTWTPGTSSLLVRREVFDRLGVFDERLGSITDLDLTMRFASARKWSVDVLPEIVVDHCIHSGNLSSRVTADNSSNILSLVDRHSLEIAKFPKVEAEYFYRAARLKFLNEEIQDGWSLLLKSVRTYPFHNRASFFLVIKVLGLEKLWKYFSVIMSREANYRRKRKWYKSKDEKTS